jgi:hypothetical protein
MADDMTEAGAIGGAGLGKFIGGFIQRAKQAKTLRAAIDDYAPRFAAGDNDPATGQPVTPDQVEKLTPEGQSRVAWSHTAGLPDLEGYWQGETQKRAAQKTQADIAEQQGRAKYYSDFGDMRKQQEQTSKDDEADRENISNMLGDFSKTHLMPGETPDVDPDTGEPATDKKPFNPMELLMGAMQAGVKPRNLQFISQSLKDVSGYGTDTEDKPNLTQVPSGPPGSQGYHTIPVLTRGKGWTQVDPAYGAAARGGETAELQTQREAARTKLAPKDLLKSYQDELTALNNPMNWSGTTPEDRAGHRAELTGKIEQLRGNATGAPAAAATAAKGSSALSSVPAEKRTAVGALQQQLVAGKITKQQFKDELGKLGIQ